MAFDRRPLPPGTPGTRKLFLADPYRREATARVLHVEHEFVVLDQTVFYAESGGQEWDEGLIGGVRVVDVQAQGGFKIEVNHPQVRVPAVTVGTAIVHRLSSPLDAQVGDEVSMAIDWERRYENMRQHSASHFLFHAVQKLCGVDREIGVKGCHIWPTGHRFDFQENLDAEVIQEVEAFANDLLSEATDIEMLPEASSPEIGYWTCGDIIIPCGGTHVRSARELEPIRLKRSKKGAGLTRVAGQFISSFQPAQ